MRFESDYSICTGRSSENISSSSGGAQEKRKEGMKLSLSSKLVEKLIWVPVILFCKIFIPSYAFGGLLCRNWLVSPPSHITLSITQMYNNLCTLQPPLCPPLLTQKKKTSESSLQRYECAPNPTHQING